MKFLNTVYQSKIFYPASLAAHQLANKP